MDGETALRLSNLRKLRLNTVTIPLLRAWAFVALGAMAAIHNAIVFGSAWSTGLGIWLIAGASYCALGTLALRRWYKRRTTWNLAKILLRLDLVLGAGLVWISGGPASWLFFLPYVRVADQVLNGWRWCRHLAFLGAIAHIAALAASHFISGVPIDFAIEGMKIMFGFTASMYVALGARAGESSRERDRSTVRLARILVQDLKASTKELEVARRRAEDAVASKSMFLATMSHELRTPMNGIIGMTDLTLGTRIDRTQREYLSTVKESAHSLLEMINEILDFSKLEAGQMEVTSQAFSLRTCLHQALKVSAVRAHEKRLILVCNVAETVPDTVMGDDLRLRQILVNLIGNAVKFTAAGHVRVRVQRVRNGNSLEIAVEDTGVGIPEDKLATIFDAFTQAEQTTTRRFGGTGLGLSISRELTLEMGGSLEVESTMGVGSQFTITLPLVEAEAIEGAVPCGPISPEATRLPIAVLAPQEVLRDSLAEQLRGWSAEVRTFTSANDFQHSMGGVEPSFVAVICSAEIPPGDRARVDATFPKSARPPWIMLQLTTGHSEGGSPPNRTTHLLQPVVGSSLRDTLERVTEIEPVRASAALAREAFGIKEKPKVEGLSAARSLSILLVEDNAVNQRVARILLDSWGHAVTIADNGQIALDQLNEGTFDVVLMDMQMPVMDGLEATRAVREIEAATGAESVPIVAMTANTMPSDIDRCKDAGMNDYVPKPISPDELFRVIERTASLPI